jgi:hypothetical protein
MRPVSGHDRLTVARAHDQGYRRPDEEVSSQVYGRTAARAGTRAAVVPAALLALVAAVAVLLAGCAGGPDSGGDGSGSRGAGPPVRDEADIRRAVTTHGRNVAWALGRMQQFGDNAVAAAPCQGSSPPGAYEIRGRFDVPASPAQYEGGLDRLRQQWQELGWRTESTGSGTAISRLVGHAPGQRDSVRITVDRVSPPAGFRIEVVSPCYSRPE